jgi:hypothetical protein
MVLCLQNQNKSNDTTLSKDLKICQPRRLKAIYLIDMRTTLQDVGTLISAQTTSLKAHDVHDETLVSRNQRDGTLTLSPTGDQLTTTLEPSQLP